MNRLPFIALWIVVIVVASFMLYRVKYEVQSLKAQIVAATLEMQQEKELLHVEAAEWAYLNRPDNLNKLADKYLKGKDVTVEQVAEVEAIAFHKQSVAVADADGDAQTIAASYRSTFARR